MKSQIFESYQEANSSLFLENSPFNEGQQRVIIRNQDEFLKEKQIEQNNLTAEDQILYAVFNNNILQKRKQEYMMMFLNYLLKAIHFKIEKQKKKQFTLEAFLFGSFVQGTSLQQDSDIDVILNFKGLNIGYTESIKLIKNICQYDLEKGKFQVEYVITDKIRIPYINVTLIKHNVKVDIIYDNPLGIWNSQLFSTYLDIHQKIKMLCVLFKIWAKNMKIKEKFKLTSYALMNMVIYFLIQENYIHSLHDSNFFGFSSKKETIDVYCSSKLQRQQVYRSFEQDHDKIVRILKEKKNLSALDNISLHELFKRLIIFYQKFSSYNFENILNRKVISVLPEAIQGDLKEYKNECRNWISIQDPFDCNYNPGSRREFNKNEFMSALYRTPDSLSNGQRLIQLFS